MFVYSVYQNYYHPETSPIYPKALFRDPSAFPVPKEILEKTMANRPTIPQKLKPKNESLI